MKRRIGLVVRAAVLLLVGASCKSGSSAGPTPIPRPIGTIGGTFEQKVHFILPANGGTVEQTQTFKGNVIWEESETAALGHAQDFMVAGGTVTVTTDIILTSPQVSCTGSSQETYQLERRGNLTVDLGSGAYKGRLVQDVPAISYVLQCQGLANGSGTIAGGTTGMQLDIKGTAEIDILLMHLRGTSPPVHVDPSTDVTGKWDFIVAFEK